MKAKLYALSIAAIVALIVLFSTMYTVTEGQQALLLRLGKLVVNSQSQVKVIDPGLHFKLPLIVTAKLFDVRLQTLDVEASRILTAEQKYVLVNYFAKWRINDLPLYYKRTGGQPFRAQTLLKQKINDALRAAFGNRTIREVVSDERADIMHILKEKANASAKGLGIKVIDVRIQGIELPQAVREAVFQRMSTEREQVATKLRSQGRAAAEAIRANADASVAVTVAGAQTNAQEIRAEGDKQAAIIYTKAYTKNPVFYALFRSLQAYRQVFSNNKQTLMILKPDGEFFKYFTQSANKNVVHTPKKQT